MRKIQTDILVIGGGATGTGILRDIALRGLKCILVERRDLAYGTTGRYHGLLHSGGRYVVKDPQAARECYEENIILRKIMPQCIEDTGGFFVSTPYDDPEYVPQFIEGCRKAGIPVEEVSLLQMHNQEPLLDEKIQRCFFVPDASADSFLAADLNARSAQQHGAVVLPYHEVTQLIGNSRSLDSLNVSGALCHDLINDEVVQIDASLIVNASGAWVGKIARMVGINLFMVPGKGTMVALNHRIVNTVINRCKMPSDGDILVPTHTVAVMGTTDIRVTDPDHYSIEPWEIRLMLDEGEKIIPGFSGFRMLRAWAGVRPLIQETKTTENRDISRSFTLIDHAVRDGVDGLITITGGKWTTYRKMAQVTVDKVCEKLSIECKCTTHLEPLPSTQENKPSKHYLGLPLQEIEEEKKYGELVCECELATRKNVENAIVNSNAITLDDIRRDVRLGMGPCQAAFCALRAAGLLHNLRQTPVQGANNSLQNFLQERWKGNLPIMWGQQLRQQRFNELIYISNLNVMELPGKYASNLSPESYTAPKGEIVQKPFKPIPPAEKPTSASYAHKSDVVVIGSGLSGLIAGWRISLTGKKVHVISKGWGATYWSTGCIDLFGYEPPEYSTRIDTPGNYLEKFIESNPNHPFAFIGLETIQEALLSFMSLSKEYGNPSHGSIDRNMLLPTALGSIRPTCLAPQSMIAGDVRDRKPMLVIGFENFIDFYPLMIADNLVVQGVLARSLSLDLKSLRTRKFITGIVLARLFDDPEFRQEVIDAIKPSIGNSGRIGFPAVLGLHHHQDVMHHLESELGLPVFEIPGLPPSIPGIRLQNMLISEIERNNGSVSPGMPVVFATVDHGSVLSVWSEASARWISHQASNYILATGGILGGGISTFDNGYAQETIFGIELDLPEDHSSWFRDKFLSHASHLINTKGLKVDQALHPINDLGQIFYNNLYVVGSNIGNCDPIRERSKEGIALATGYKVGEILSKSETI